MNDLTLPHDHDTARHLAHLEAELLRVNRFERVADIFKQLSDTTRVRVFWLLCHTEQCVINIAPCWTCRARRCPTTCGPCAAAA